jgi:hypothetical protein
VPDLRKQWEPPVGIEPTTYALRGSPTWFTAFLTCGFAAARLAGPHCHRLSRRQFASQPVSRRRVRRGCAHGQDPAAHAPRDPTQANGDARPDGCTCAYLPLAPTQPPPLLDEVPKYVPRRARPLDSSPDGMLLWTVKPRRIDLHT